MQRNEKDWAKSIATYDQAIRLSGPDSADGWDLVYGRGIAFERAGEFDKAEADFLRALEMLPKARRGNPLPQRAQVLNYLAYSWVDRHLNIERAFEMLREAVELTQRRDGYIVDSLGWAHFRLGQYDEAVRELEAAVELKPGDPVINDHLGDAYWKVGRTREARFQMEHARDLKPEPEDLARILDKIAMASRTAQRRKRAAIAAMAAETLRERAAAKNQPHAACSRRRLDGYHDLESLVVFAGCMICSPSRRAARASRCP